MYGSSGRTRQSVELVWKRYSLASILLYEEREGRGSTE